MDFGLNRRLTSSQLYNEIASRRLIKTALFLSCCPLLLVSTQAYAQVSGSSNPPVDNDASDVGEIIVTAQKRAERLSDVGLSITAATGPQLRAAGINNVSDLPRITPGFTTGTVYVGYPVFSIRGINFNASQLAASPAVSTYMDEAIIPYSPMTSGILFDLERAEVLKGPQGTLFGQNATAGSINLIAAKPTATLSAGFDGEVNNFGQVVLNGFVSGPLSETVRVRLAATTTQFGAWQKGYALNQQKNGDQDRASARMLVDWTPTDRLKVALNVNGNYDNGEDQAFQLQAVKSTASGALVGYPLPRRNQDADFDTGFDTRRHNRQYQGVLRVDYDITDDARLTSISDYINSRLRYRHDFDGTAVPSVYGNTGGSIKTFNQEVRLTGKLPSGRISYILGANYQKDKIFDQLDSFFPGYSGLTPGSELDSRYYLSNRTLGLYGNVDLTVVQNLTVTAGVRYTSTRQTVQGCNYANAVAGTTLGFVANLFRSGAGLGPTTAYDAGGCSTINDVGPNPDYLPIAADAVQKEHNVSWRAGINYKVTPDDLVYALVSRGFKAGTFTDNNLLLQSQFGAVKQEEITSYEVGAKLAFFDRKLRINVAGFYYDYLNKQFFTYKPVPILGVSALLVNIPKSTAKGIDADITINPVRGLTLRSGVTYVKTSVGNFTGFDTGSSLIDFTKKEFNFAPPLSIIFDAEYRFALNSSLQAYVGAGGVYNDRTYSDLGEVPSARIPERTIVDVRAGLESDNNWRVGLFVRNLADKQYWTSTALGGDTLTRFAGMPRTFGISWGLTF
jgi:outer membrane receptor protein involved in Fe transport